MSHTPGPWRWADWHACYGSMEREDHKSTLEYNPVYPGFPDVVRADRDICPTRVLCVEDVIEMSPYDKELIRRAPELLAALVEMLDLADERISLSTDQYVKFRALTTFWEDES